MSYEIRIEHEGLHKIRVVRAREPWEAEAKARAQLRAWEEQWERKVEAENRRRERAAVTRQTQERKEAGRTEAEEITAEAERTRLALKGTLAHTLPIDDAVDWSQLLDTREFADPKPQKPALPPQPEKPRESVPVRPEDKPSVIRRLYEFLAPSAHNARLEREASIYDARLVAAKKAYRRSIEGYNQEAQEYNDELRRLEGEWKEALAAWRRREAEFHAEREEHNRKIQNFEQRYRNREPDAITDYCELVLQKSEYPEFFPGNFDLQFCAETQILIVDLDLPTPDRFPAVKSAQYVASRDEIKRIEYKDAEKRKLYDSVIYQVALRTIHELYEADTVRALESIVFNGRTNSVDRATGSDVLACILSVQTTRDDFLTIDLSRIDPAKCIRKLRGVSATTLVELTPVAPVMSIDRDDARFVEGEAVMTNIAGGDNLAAMDWEQFEHLVRELFEKEFAGKGSEVRVTQASRDGGVDAVIFDPDPIRGGKFVVQAKRYTLVVPVSAVRDLYGTLVNEGAVKGILVTTAYFGPDSYAFAKDKPLTLLDGSNLLSMLEKHGTHAHIDLQSARKLLESNG